MKVLRYYRFRRGTLILFFCMSVLSGLGMARWMNLGPVYLAVNTVVLSIFWRKASSLTLLALILFGLSLGLWRGSIYLQRLGDYDGYYYQKLTVQVVATEDALYGKTKQLAFAADNIILENGEHLKGKIQVSGFGENAVYQGDTLLVTGKLYPGFGAYQGRLSFAMLDLRSHHNTIVGELRRKFAAGMQTALPEPVAPFAMGLLVGQRANLPDEVKQDLLMVGLTHIIAVSGYNLTIILHASKRLLANRSKRLSTALSLGLIAVFLLLAGASASIVRAAIVSLLSIATSYYGRNLQPLTLIAMAGAITAYANPVYIWSDLSWYLSFLAFYGVMILSPLIQKRLRGNWHQTLVGGVALESVCAEIMSLPFVLHIFGQMSLIGLPANVLVVALIPLGMLLGVIAGLAGMLAGSFAGWFAWPANILLSYMLDVAHMMASIPHIFIQNKSLSLLSMLSLYLLIVLICASLHFGNKDAKSDIITGIDEPKTRGLLA